MASAALGLLENKIDAGVSYRVAHMVGFVTDNRVHIFGGHNLRRGVDDMGQQRFSADFMQDFRMFRLEPGAFAGGHDSDCDPGRSCFAGS